MKGPDDTLGDAAPLVPIATVPHTPADVQAVEEALNEAGIHCEMEGSRVYRIYVRPEDADRAVDILKKSRAGDRTTFY